ncbi:hypothetical protein SAMN02799630_05012 [Paenibacillus sp. UNCCL117]|uniref:hypothetical protein n=1 Tax=unclassified Paenibacillus TaxID=185978 RepID=UPI00087F4E9A|nr:MULTISPECIES: hypothetical protein [unclassified Paenibacillus]SDE25771.1 hypothetical protein SAMN04488602_12325 [Paenibacillus sp. cl123]SFW62488.1 hypothetical protein SAMN02799630_05012 [Paenibacillus sp. UNCCL117]
MPAIAKIRFTNIVYEQGAKRYTDAIFRFDGHNGAIVLENGGGKTVFIQTAIQAVLPHADVAGRKMRDTLSLENGPAHIAIEWLLAEKPRRRYAATCVSLFMSATGLDSLRYVVEYGERDDYGIGDLPFTKDHGGKRRLTEKGEIQEYYQTMQQRNPLTARTFDTIKGFHEYIEKQLHIIPSEWEAIVKINSNEGGIEAFFDDCKTTSQLVDRLLVPTIEDSMEGYRQGTFVDLFQTQREGFKQYKELKEKLEENRRILAELHKFVQGFEKLHLRQTEYTELRQEAKAYLQLAVRQEGEQLAEQERLRERTAAWQEKQTQWRQKEASLRIAAERQKEGALDSALQEIEGEREQLEDQLSQAKRLYYSLRYAEHREHQREAEAALSYVREQFGRLEESQDERELQLRWERNGSGLRAWYAAEERRQRELTALLEQEAQELEQRKRDAATDKAEADRGREQLAVREAGLEAERKGLQSQRDDIARRILSNRQSQSVEEQMPLWISEQQLLEEEYLQHQRVLTEGERRRSELQQQIREAKAEQLRVVDELTRLQERQKQCEREHQAVKQELALLRPAWERLGPVQEKQSSLLAQLADDIERRQRQKLQLLHKERLAFRHVDDYAELPVFFADSAVSRLVQQWSRQFSLLEIGVHYADQAVWEQAESEESGLWPVTLVTTVQEKAQLQRKLAEAADQLSYPIRVLSTQEVRELELRGQASMAAGAEPPETAVGAQALAETESGRAQEERPVKLPDNGEGAGWQPDSRGESWIEPSLWRSLQQPERFAEWKRSVGDKAREAEQARKQKEQELEQWQDARKRLQTFLAEYPLEGMQELERQLAELRDRQLRLEGRMDRDGHELEALERKKDELQQAIQLNRQRQQQLEAQVEQGLRHKRLGEQLAAAEQELLDVQQSMQRAVRLVESRQRRLDAWTQEHERKQGELRSAQDKLQRLLEDELYGQVKEYEPLDTDYPLSRLKEERRDLELQRLRIMKDRAELEEQQQRQEARSAAAMREMSRLLAEYPGLSPDLELPSRLEARLHEALGECQNLERQVARIRGQQERKQGELIEQRAAIKLLLEQYEAQFPGEKPRPFLTALSRVQEELAAERKLLESERRELDKLQQAAEQRLADITKVLQLWNRYERTHVLDDPLLEPADLTLGEETELGYRLLDRSRAAIDGLEQKATVIQEESKRVAANRNRFKEFCARQVRDVKLREMAERGVDLKESFTELQEFHAMMETSILKANHIAELRMQTEDQKLEQYISHIQTHLRQIAGELRDLPKKTRVRTETGNKEIYVFQVPEWEEQDGKERIRTHLEWMIGQLDSPRYRNEQGEEQAAAVRKDLEKWLDAKQLLHKVLQQAAIRISCRKVTNDQQVTGATYSWEESNRWSGGEKWSKNMTLFLGLLNYVAEKRQHIQSQMKRHRTVILDNPFGKASSDHVLSPVFYIAEQLGFQILALTAHAEGKFLQDYFPVVYSCRLRAAAGGSGKQIVDPQQNIQQAYFQDHAPESMERIGEVRQMELF